MSTLIFIGLPGSGKGTQTDILVKKHNFVSVCAGDLIRKFLKQDKPDIQKIRDSLSSGKLMPDSMVNDIISEELKLLDLKSKIILDGYPRSIEQAKYLESNILKSSKTIVINLEIDSALLLSRIKGRYNCVDCGKIYNDYNRPKISSICDYCKGSNFSCRKDDNGNALRKRIDEYNNITSKVVDYYKEKNLLYSIKADSSISSVSSQIVDIINNNNF